MAKKEEPKKPEQDDLNGLIQELHKQPDSLINVPKTLMKKEEWGLLTVMSLLLAGMFPAYFVNIMLMSFFSGLGHLFTTHLTEVERAKLLDFEKEFRLGYEKEQQSLWKEAIEIYSSLSSKYSANPKIASIADKRIDWIKNTYHIKGE